LDRVLEHLAIGDARDGLRPDPQVTALLCVAAELAPPAARAVAHQVPIVDMQPIPARQLAEAVEWIAGHVRRQTILVYCNAGVGRSSSVVIAYLYLHRAMGFGGAVEQVAERHPFMSLLPGLLPTLKALRRAPDGY